MDEQSPDDNSNREHQPTPSNESGTNPTIDLYATSDGSQSVIVDSGGLKIRCPHCQNPIEVVDVDPRREIDCPSCGNSFSLIDGGATATFNQTAARKVGHFELLEILGTGAFGSVWKARDTQLDRVVAIKIPRKSQLDAEEAEQFFREARAAAQLRHPNIVSVHEVGRDGGTIYIVSDLVRGVNLSDWLTGQKLTLREAAEICAKVATALDHAHKNGVIHRDLKPGNIMLDADGQPHIMDFGLAKREAGEITMTVEGRILGTPAYMSPEQARGDTQEVNRRTDIYSLGVILFQLLTGELPFRGTPRMLLHQVLNEEPRSPRSLNDRIPRDLETICVKAMAKEAGRRYYTAKAMANDLEKWLEGRPIQARPIRGFERGWRWCKRNRALSFWIGAFTLSMLYPLVFGIIGIGSYLKLIPESRLRSDFGLAPESVVSGVMFEKCADLEKVLGWDDIEATVIRFSGGPATDFKTFYTGGRIRVWAELEKDGHVTKVFDTMIELHASPTSKSEPQSTYALLRHPKQEDGTEDWRLKTVSDHAKSVSVIHRGMRIWSKHERRPFDATEVKPQREVDPGFTLLHRATRLETVASPHGNVVGPEVDVCLWEIVEDSWSASDGSDQPETHPGLNLQYDHKIRIMCRLERES